MIDVVFLLLVFFMLASRFGTASVLSVTSPSGGASTQWQGPPRLITIHTAGLSLNGVPVAAQDVPAKIAPLLDTPADPILIRAVGKADLQALIDLLERLSNAGFSGAMVVE